LILKELDRLFKIRYDLISNINSKEINNLRYFAVMERDYKKILFYNRKIDRLTENILLLNEINQKIKEARIEYNNYLIKNNKKDFYR
jgi:hypothetical protein